MNIPIISIVLGSYNRLTFLRSTIASIRSNGIAIPYEIIVIDGGSSDGSINWLIKQKDIITIVQHNHGNWSGKPVERRSWGYFMNIAFKATHGKYILMVSDDCLLVRGAVMNGYQAFEQLLEEGHNVGALAFYWRNWPDQQDYRVGLTLGDKMFVNHGLYLRTALEEVGWIDEVNYTFYHADGDLCLKLWQKGYIVLDCTQAFIEHFMHANTEVRSVNLLNERRDWENYTRKWEGIFYDRVIDNGGRWIKKQFDDPDQTYLSFISVMRWITLRRRLNSYWKKVMRFPARVIRRFSRIIMRREI